MSEIKIQVQKKKVTTTADGGYDMVFSASDDQKIEVAKVMVMPLDMNLELVIRYGKEKEEEADPIL